MPRSAALCSYRLHLEGQYRAASGCGKRGNQEAGTFGPEETGPAAAARVVPSRSTGAVTDQIIVGDRILLASGFRAARARLEILTRDEVLTCASEVAYGAGITALVEAAGPAAGLTRLAWICTDTVAGTGDCAHLAVWWEAIAADGKLFTALDADLMLVPAGDKHTSVGLAGAYRPQPGPNGAGLDRAVLRSCAMVAVGSFLDQVACALVHPAGAARRHGQDA